jgi:hypothetical protein
MPGLTDSMGDESGVWLTVEYGADVLPEDLGAAGAYGTDGGEFSEGEIGCALPPASARRVWFDFYATTDEDHRACRLTIDLATKRVQIER